MLHAIPPPPDPVSDGTGLLSEAGAVDSPTRWVDAICTALALMAAGLAWGAVVWLVGA